MVVIGARANSMLFNFRPPRFNEAAKFVEVNIDDAELGRNRPVEVGIVGDADMVLKQLTEEARGRIDSKSWAAWTDELRAQDAAREERSQTVLNSDQTPIHPLRLCKELREAMDRDAILVVDGNEILGFARHSIPSFLPRHRINAGPHGVMGIGVPFGIGAQVAHPDKQVIVLSGDGSFGWNGMDMDTAVRFKLPIKVIISNNAGFTAQGGYAGGVGRELGWVRYDKMMEAPSAATASGSRSRAISAPPSSGRSRRRGPPSSTSRRTPQGRRRLRRRPLGPQAPSLKGAPS